MIEVLIVLAVIGILTSVLLVGVRGVSRAMETARVVAEIKGLERGIAEFRAEFGMDPPSWAFILEGGSASSAAVSWGRFPPTLDARIQKGRQMVREVWPSFDFEHIGDPPGTTTASPGNPIPGNSCVDIDGDGTEGSAMVMSGAQCLAFFLGGVQTRQDSDGDGSVDTVLTHGFSTNPRAPFLRGGKRLGPYFDFNPKQFFHHDQNPVVKVSSYMDSIPGQTKPILYFSSYGGRGYRIFGLDGVHLGLGGDDEVLSTGSIAHMRSVYLQGPASGSNPASPFNPNTFQIISPGADGEYGIGGYVDPEKGVMFMPGDDPARNNPAELQKERDNITNFSNGPLR